jgi:hypothetical protein
VRQQNDRAGVRVASVPHDSDSAVQREAEIEILKGISGLLGKPLGKRHIDLPGGTWVEVDGAAADLSVFAEAFAHQGRMKGGQKRKVALDVLKLITLQRVHPGAHLVLAFCDEAAMNSLTGWIAEAIEAWKVDRMVAALEADLRARLIEVQARQYR